MRLAIIVWALGASTPLWASNSASAADASRVRAVGPAIQALIVSGADRSQSFRELLSRVEQTNWIVFVMRGRCPEPGLVACLLHTVGTFEGNLYLRIVIDDRWPRSPDVEIGSIAHELQHTLEAAEAADVVDTVSLKNHFRRIGYTALKSRVAIAYETAAARRAGFTVQRELQYSQGRNADAASALGNEHD